MIKFDSDFATVSLDFEDSVRTQNVSVHIFRDKRRKFEQNGVKITKMSEIVGALRAVLFSPDNLSLIKNGPSERRSWLDVALCQSRPLYMQSLSRFNKILKQRNNSTTIISRGLCPDTTSLKALMRYLYQRGFIGEYNEISRTIRT